MFELLRIFLPALASLVRKRNDLVVKNLLLRRQLQVSLRSRPRPALKTRDWYSGWWSGNPAAVLSGNFSTDALLAAQPHRYRPAPNPEPAATATTADARPGRGAVHGIVATRSKQTATNWLRCRGAGISVRSVLGGLHHVYDRAA